ncbi:hypothetical protein ACJRPK_14150 [Aquimarina sp. 2-A2]|uniref:hypothetical protein n=1 Tax=Aquimarina sp. 2-A2 TaxID=3382644 RepID=UPI00387F2E01
METNLVGLLVFITVIAVIGFLSPLSHVYYLENDEEGVFGFTWMSSFLFAIGFPIYSLCMGFFMNLASTLFSTVEKKKFKIMAIVFKVLGVKSFFLGALFLVWSFSPNVKDFDPSVYYRSLVLVSVLISISLVYFSNYVFNVNKTIKNLKASLKSMFGFVYDMPSNDLVNPLKIKEFDINKLKITNSILDQNEQ